MICFGMRSITENSLLKKNKATGKWKLYMTPKSQSRETNFELHCCSKSQNIFLHLRCTDLQNNTCLRQYLMSFHLPEMTEDFLYYHSSAFSTK